MRVEAIDGFTARCEARGATREASLFMLQDEDVRVGDYLMIQVGYAVRRVSEAEAMASWELYDQILGTLDGKTV
jgi:hydrogenase expression/formation protein HypC